MLPLPSHEQPAQIRALAQTSKRTVTPAASLVQPNSGGTSIRFDGLTGRRLPTQLTRVVTAGAVAVAAASLAIVLRNTPPAAPTEQHDEDPNGEADTAIDTDTE